ncbi:MAG: hypothetical protein R3C32_14915 [Chloroflexota bacterium]
MSQLAAGVGTGDLAAGGDPGVAVLDDAAGELGDLAAVLLGAIAVPGEQIRCGC